MRPSLAEAGRSNEDATCRTGLHAPRLDYLNLMSRSPARAFVCQSMCAEFRNVFLKASAHARRIMLFRPIMGLWQRDYRNAAVPVLPQLLPAGLVPAPSAHALANSVWFDRGRVASVSRATRSVPDVAALRFLPAPSDSYPETNPTAVGSRVLRRRPARCAPTTG